MTRRLLSPAQLLLQLGERFGQPLGVGVESVVRNLDGLSARELFEALRQVGCLRHRRAVDEHRDHGHVALKRRLDFDADKIIGVVEAAAVLRHVGRGGCRRGPRPARPLRPDRQ